MGLGTLTGGVATFSTVSLAVGSHSITASYGGDANAGPGAFRSRSASNFAGYIERDSEFLCESVHAWVRR